LPNEKPILAGGIYYNVKQQAQPYVNADHLQTVLLVFVAPAIDI
jgi:hypothetical protein